MKNQISSYLLGALLAMAPFVSTNANAAATQLNRTIEQLGQTREELDLAVLDMRDQMDLQCQSLPGGSVEEHLSRYSIERPTGSGKPPLRAHGVLTTLCQHK
jgi:hypothetical protein